MRSYLLALLAILLSSSVFCRHFDDSIRSDDILHATSLEDYESDTFFRHPLIDDSDLSEDDDQAPDDEDDYETFERTSRDTIRGPSLTPRIDDDTASEDLSRENNDMDGEETTKRKLISNKPDEEKIGKEISDSFMFPEHPTKEDIDESSGVPAHHSNKKHKILSKADKALVSESLINLLYDWKKHNTPKSPSEKHAMQSDTLKQEQLEADQVISKLRKASHNLLSAKALVSAAPSKLGKAVSPVVDAAQVETAAPAVETAAPAVVAPPVTSVVSPAAADVVAPATTGVVEEPNELPTAFESTANALHQNKERFNVLVNVNINERAARKSNINRHVKLRIGTAERRSIVSQVNKTKPLASYQQYPAASGSTQQGFSKPVVGALEKLRADTSDLEADGEASGADEGSGSATVKSKVGDLSETEAEEADVESGSSDGEDNDNSSTPSDLKKAKVTGTEQKAPKVTKKDKPFAPQTTEKQNATLASIPVEDTVNRKKYNPKHALDEERQALKGETPEDTLTANKMAADKEQKANNLEQNENISTPNQNASQAKLNKTSEVSSNKDTAENSNFAKPKEAEAEDVSIAEIKSPKPPKSIPSEAALMSGSQPKMPSDKNDDENDEIAFTKKEREEQMKKLLKSDDTKPAAEVKKVDEGKKKESNDDKYETLAEVREKFKKWENKMESKKVESTKPKENTGDDESLPDNVKKVEADSDTLKEDSKKADESEKPKKADEQEKPKAATADPVAKIQGELLKGKPEKEDVAVKPEKKEKEVPQVSKVSLKEETQIRSASKEKMASAEKEIEKATDEILQKATKATRFDNENAVKYNNHDSAKITEDTKPRVNKNVNTGKSVQESKNAKENEDDDNVEDEDEKAQKQTKKKDELKTPITNKEKAHFQEGVDKLKAKHAKQAKEDADALSSQSEEIGQTIGKELNKIADKVAAANDTISDEEEVRPLHPAPVGKVFAQSKESLANEFNTNIAKDFKKNATSEISIKANSQSLKQLNNFKNQILSEVEKINRLEAEYGIEDHSTRDLDEAKDVLNKDLKVVRELEKNLLKKSKDKVKEKAETKAQKPANHRQLNYQPDSPMEVQQLQSAAIQEQEKAEAFDKEIASALQQKAENEVNTLSPPGSTAKPASPSASAEEESEIIPETKLGFEMAEDSLKKDEKVAKQKKAKKSKKKKKKKSGRNSKKHHPLAELHSLLKAEIRRLKLPNRGKNDPQLSNIRQLVQQRLKSMLENGDLDKAAVHNLTPDIKELGKLLKNRIKNEKKRRSKKSKKRKTSASSVTKDYGNTQLSAGEQISNLQTDIGSLANPTPSHKSNGNNSLTSQSSKMKSLLTTLNKKLGEIYSKAQGVHAPGVSPPANSPPASSTPQHQPAPPPQAHPIIPQSSVDPSGNGNLTMTSFQSPTPGNPEPRPIYIPTTFSSATQQSQDSASQMLTPHSSYNQPPLQKAEIHATQTLPPALAQEPEFTDAETTGQKPLADDEPVDTLVENLERDITEVWSYRNMFPDAESLGLDNDKVHNTYANLGSLSGLNLRRALNRALRGEDVGLAVVGGSISKGGPFSEKGLDFVLRSYFYAIEDYWNKIIRPVTGSSMIIRDVSIGGIATDYYSYCLQNHLPDDKLTNIVLWELSANDMKRYEDTNRPKPQPLEQFTRNVLSYRAKPALIYLNFFALFDWDPDLAAHCRNFEDEGEDDIAKYYKITSLSWRNMVCPLLASGNQPLFTRSKLFAEDNFHPSILAHAQMSYIVIDYIRTEFLKNLVKMRNTVIADAVTRLQIPKTIYIPRPMFPQTFTWKPLCYTYMLVDNRSPNNTLPIDEEKNGNFRYTVVREFKIRSDKIVGMETQTKDQYIRYRMHIPRHETGTMTPYKRLGIMSFTDDRTSSIQFDAEAPKDIDTKKRFLEGTVIKYISENVVPGEHSMTIRSGNNGFLVCAVVIG